MAMIVDNPAARLLDILKVGKLQQNTLPCRTVWHNLLAVPNGDHALLLERIAKLMTLPQAIAIEMQEHYPDFGDVVGHWRAQVDGAFINMSLSNPWDSFIGRIDQHSIMHLNSTAKLLQVVAKFKPMKGADLDDIREKINALLVEVKDSALDDNLKLSIIRCLNQIVSSVNEYFITGVTPILDAINCAYGRAFTDAQYQELIRGESTLGQKLRNVLQEAATVTTIAANLHEIAPLLDMGWKLLTAS